MNSPVKGYALVLSYSNPVQFFFMSFEERNRNAYGRDEKGLA